jgi:hypothetical protein
VDEYQDTNRLQFSILHRMRALDRNLTVVGDDAQSIYSFRAAERHPKGRLIAPGFFSNVERSFAHHECPGCCKHFREDIGVSCRFRIMADRKPVIRLAAKRPIVETLAAFTQGPLGVNVRPGNVSVHGHRDV